MKLSTLRISAAAAAIVVLSACEAIPNVTQDQGTLIGAGTGAVAGALVSGGIILPAAAAVGGAIVGEEVAENDPIFD